MYVLYTFSQHLDLLDENFSGTEEDYYISRQLSDDSLKENVLRLQDSLNEKLERLTSEQTDQSTQTQIEESKVIDFADNFLAGSLNHRDTKDVCRVVDLFTRIVDSKEDATLDPEEIAFMEERLAAIIRGEWPKPCEAPASDDGAHASSSCDDGLDQFISQSMYRMLYLSSYQCTTKLQHFHCTCIYTHF